MHRSVLLAAVGCVLGIPTHNSLWADAYSDAERSAKDLIYFHEEFTRLNKEQIKNLIQAIAEGDQEERKDIAERAGREARDKVMYEYSKAENRKNEALSLLDAVLKNPAFKDKYRDAEELKTKVNEKWASIERMSQGVRGANHPVIVYLLQMGKDLHSSRQRGCPVYEFETGNGPVDCIRTTCDIIEFKPNNTRAKSQGEDQLRRYRKGLLENADKRKELNSKDSGFAKCTDFHMTIEAYKLLPEVNDDGSFREVSADWSSYSVNP